MSISLNNHESRIAALEKKVIDASSVVVEADWGRHGYCVLRGGLMFNWGYGTFYFKKAFPNACCGITNYSTNNDGNWASDSKISSWDRTRFWTYRGSGAYFIAIGYYLISNRVRSFLSSFLKGVNHYGNLS